MGKTLYVSDLDGTLLDDSSRISQSSVELLNRAIADGADFSIATARTPATVGPLLEKVEMRLPAIVMTGVSFWNPVSKRYSHTRFMDPEIPERLLEIYRRHKVPTFLYTLEDEIIRIYHEGPMSPIEKEFLEQRSHTPYKKVCISPDGESRLPAQLDNVLLFYAMQPTGEARPVFEETRLIKEINPMFYHDMYGPEIALLEAFPKEATKAKAVKLLAKETGADRIVAFGDNLNDLPMLDVADVAVAVGNAVDEIKAKADIIIEDNTSDAVARFIASDHALQTCDVSNG